MKKTKYGRCDTTKKPRLRHGYFLTCAPNLGEGSCPLLPNSRIKPKHGRGSK